jgi:hypothetical protein
MYSGAAVSLSAYLYIAPYRVEILALYRILFLKLVWGGGGLSLSRVLGKCCAWCEFSKWKIFFEEISFCKFIIANLWSAYQRVKFLKRLSASEIFETLISEWNFSGSQAFKFTKIKRTNFFFTECEQKCLRNIFISYFFIFQGCSPVPKFG